MEKWLVRTATNLITGPYNRDELTRLILDRKLSLQDEICRSHGYWIFIHERDEVFKQLGISIPRINEHGEEVTETNTEVLLEQEKAVSAQGEVGTTVLSSASKQNKANALNSDWTVTSPDAPTAPAAASIDVSDPAHDEITKDFPPIESRIVEPTSYWRLVALLLLLGLALLIYAFLKILQ